jgi:uncharacterized protein (TIGR02117 family)
VATDAPAATDPAPTAAATAPPKRRSWRRRLLRWLLFALLALVAFVLLYAGAVWLLGSITVHDDYRPADEGVPVMIVSNGIHTDFYLPARHPKKDWTKFAPLEDMTVGNASAPHVLIGWGDRGFFLDTPTWDDLSIGTTAAAVLLPTPSVMHIYYHWYLPVPDERCRRLYLRDDEYERFCAYVERGFARDADGDPILIAGRSYTPGDVFYEGVGSYHLFHTCNNWASGALRAAGVRQPLWSPLDGAIFEHLPAAR